MSILNVTQKFIVLLVLVALTLTGCGAFGAPASGELQNVEAKPTAAREDDGAASTSLEGGRVAEEPVSEKPDSAPADTSAAGPDPAENRAVVVEKEV